MTQRTMRNTNLSTDLTNLIKEVRLGNLDDLVGRVLMDVEDYVLFLESKEDRLTAIETALDKLAEKAETNPNDAGSVAIIAAMKEFATQ